MTAPILSTDLPGAAATPKYNMAYVWTISLVAAMGGLLFGYDWVVIGGAKPFFESYFDIYKNEQLVGWANSCALLGCLLGSLMTGAMSDKLGRKKLLVVSAFLFTASSVLTGWAHNFTWFVTWRILGGVAIGMASNLSPMYIAEIAPAGIRGRLVAVNQLTIVIGILAAQLVNYYLGSGSPSPSDDTVKQFMQKFALKEDDARAWATAELIRPTWYGEYVWRWMFTAVAVPSLIFFFTAIFVPESPRWLIKNGRGQRARGILARIGGTEYAEAAARDIEATIAGEEVQHVRFKDLLESRMVKILAIGVGLAVLQQWCGINVIFNYAQEIFNAAGYDIKDTLKNIAWTGTVNLVFVFVALAVVDRGGRRPLMLFGAMGLALIYIGMGICYQSSVKGLPMLVLVLSAISCYSMSLAPVVWVLISELFPNRIRGAAVSVAVSSLWIACFILTYTFPILNKALGPAWTFWLYAGICLLGFVFILTKVPETKGKTLEQIEKELVD